MLTTIDLAPLIGTQIKADRSSLLDGSDAEEILRLLDERGVLVFRGMHFDDGEQLTFSRTLGATVAQGGEDVMKVTLDPIELLEKAYLADYLKGTFYWHIDGSADEVPARASLLSAKRLSPTGGDTEFANTYAAYEELPQPDKQAIAGLRVVHTIEASQRYVRPEPTYEELLGWRRYSSRSHPLVWTHKSGRKSLVLGSTAAYVEGMSYEESGALLCRLREWATQPQFVYRHRWQPGDLVIWDNTGTMHRVIPYEADSCRLMHRTTLAGEEAIA